MNKNDLTKYFPHASSSTIRANIEAGDQGNFPRPEFQELQKDHSGKSSEAHHGPQSKTVDGKSHCQYFLSVTIRGSDQRERDLDGGLSTLLDCVCAASKRFKAYFSRNSR